MMPAALSNEHNARQSNKTKLKGRRAWQLQRDKEAMIQITVFSFLECALLKSLTRYATAPRGAERLGDFVKFHEPEKFLRDNYVEFTFSALDFTW